MSATPAEASAGFVVPGRGRGLLDVVRYRYLLQLLIRQGIKVRYRGSILGWTWSYVKPATQFGVYYLALGIFLDLNRGLENFALYLFSGLVLINLFAEAFSNATRSIVDNAPLVKKIYLPRELFPVASVIIALTHFLPQVAVLILACLLFGWIPNLAAVGAFLLGMLIIVTLATGLGLLFGSVNVSFRDAENFVDLIVLLATWTSPVLYAWTMVRNVVPEWLLQIYLAIPLPAAVELFHAAFWFPTTDGSPELAPGLWTNGAIALLLSLVVLAVGQYAFRKLEGRFAQVL